MTAAQVALKHGFRSGLEDKVAAELSAQGVGALYEAYALPFIQPEKARTYTPDFLIPNGIVVETKGRFLTDDRQKMKLVKELNPDIDIRFVFSRAQQTITKTSPTTYAMWCEKYGFPWAEGSVPQEWLNEPPCGKRIAAFYRVAKLKSKKAS